MSHVGDSPTLQLAAGDPDFDALTFGVSGGALPAGLTLSSAGVISGTITAAPGSYVVTVQVSDGTLSQDQTFEWDVYSPSAAAAQVVLEVNQTADPSDDIAQVGGPAVPVTVTLRSVGPGLHSVVLSVPTSLASLDRTVLQMADGDSAVVYLTALQVSQAVGDVLLAALADGQPAGDGKATGVKVSFPPVTHPDTPAAMLAKKLYRIPPRVVTNYTFKIKAPADFGKQGEKVFLTIEGQSDDNGRAGFNSDGATVDGILVTGTGDIKVGLRGKVSADGKTALQTKPPAAGGQSNAGKLFLRAEVGGKEIRKSAGFSVLTIPGSWVFDRAQGLQIPINNIDYIGMRVTPRPIPDSGYFVDFGNPGAYNVDVSEVVRYSYASGIFVGLPAAHSGYQAVGGLPDDKHYVPTANVRAPGGSSLAEQLIIFRDKITGAVNIPVPNSGYKIIKHIYQSDSDFKWRIAVAKFGASVSVWADLWDKYTSAAGTTDPGFGLIRVVTPR